MCIKISEGVTKNNNNNNDEIREKMYLYNNVWPKLVYSSVED